MLTLFIFIFILGLLIFVHELGHFVAAKKSGMKVEEFGFGYPPKAWGVKRGDTVYSINWIPFGGFVKIFGKENGYSNEPGSFYAAPLYKRFIVIIAGVAMNFVLGAVLLSFGYMLGLPAVIDDADQVDGRAADAKVQISFIAENSPAKNAGLQIGDDIKFLTIRDIETGADKKMEVKNTKDVIDFTAEHKGENIMITVERGSEVKNFELVPRVDSPEGEGPMGVALAKTAIVSYPWYEAIYKGFASAIGLIVLILVMFGQLFWTLFTEGHLMAEVSGPVGIYTLTGQAVGMGLVYVLQFMAMLSLNLAILNFLPLPALDGGQALFLLIEKIRKKPVSFKVEQTIHAVGFALLILLMVVITFRDVIKLF